MKTTLRQLRYLQALAHEGHFGRAAIRVNVTQPALSAQIRELELELGVMLVERHPHGARLTEIGRVILERAEKILADTSDLMAAARAARGELSGPLKLGVIPSIAPYLLPRLLPMLADRFPALDLTVRETITSQLLEELKRGDIDVVIASTPLNGTAFTEETAFEDEFLIATPRTGAYALGDYSDPGHFPVEALLLLEDGHCLRDQALAVCGALDTRRLRSTGVTSLSTILQLVAAGQGITLLPEIFLSAREAPLERIRLTRFAAPRPKRAIGLAWRRSNPQGPQFVLLTEAVRKCRQATGAEPLRTP